MAHKVTLTTFTNYIGRHDLHQVTKFLRIVRARYLWKINRMLLAKQISYCPSCSKALFIIVESFGTYYLHKMLTIRKPG